MTRTVIELLTMGAFECLPRRVRFWILACRHGECVCPYHTQGVTQ